MNCTQCGEPLDGIHILDGCKKRTSEEIIDLQIYDRPNETKEQDA